MTVPEEIYQAFRTGQRWVLGVGTGDPVVGDSDTLGRRVHTVLGRQAAWEPAGRRGVSRVRAREGPGRDRLPVGVCGRTLGSILTAANAVARLAGRAHDVGEGSAPLSFLPVFAEGGVAAAGAPSPLARVPAETVSAGCFLHTDAP